MNDHRENQIIVEKPFKFILKKGKDEPINI